MKKQLVLISLILAMFTSFAQDVQDETTSAAPQDTTVATNFSHNRVNIHFGGAFTNNIYKRIPAPEIRQTYSLGALFELGYSYFFNQHWGIGIGVGVSVAKEVVGTVKEAIVSGDGTWECPECHHKGNRGKFCEECGFKKGE